MIHTESNEIVYGNEGRINERPKKAANGENNNDNEKSK